MNRRLSVLASLLLSGVFRVAHAGSGCGYDCVHAAPLLSDRETTSSGHTEADWPGDRAADGRIEHWNLGDRLTGLYEHGDSERDWDEYGGRSRLFDQGGSDGSTFQTQSDPSAVPLPEGLWLFTSALGAGVWLLRRRTATQM